MSMSEKNILSYFKETKERVSSKRIKLDETLIESTTESALSSSKLFTEIVPKPSKSCTETVSSSAKPCTEDVVKDGKKIRQISIKEAFSKIKTIVSDESNQEVDHFKNLEGTPRHHIEPCNNRKRKVDIEATPGYGGSVISSLPRPLKNGTPSSAKKRLVMSPDDEKVNEERDGGADIVSTKGPVSPPRTPVEVHIARINCTPEPTKTPVKRVSAIQDVKSPRAKQLFGSPPKKLDPADVKAKLGKVGKLSDLQARLASVVNENLPKLHAFRQAQKEKQAKLTASDKKNLSKFDSLDLEVPVSPRKVESPRKVQPSPVKSDSPAYDKFWQLKEPGVPTLALPFKFKLLTEIFRCMDVVCSFMYNRQELITFKKLKAGVQQMLRRDFSKNHVRQIVAVYPDSYAISYEKVQLRFATPTKDENQMVITPIIEKKIGGPSVSEKGKEVSNIQKLEFRPMPPTTMVERRTIFQSKLLAIVKEHHAEYLASLIPPMHIPDDKLTRWHPCFLLDEVPDIDPEKYPESPVKQKLGSAKDILESAKSLLGRNPRILGVFESAAKREELAAENLKKGPEPLKSEEVFDTVNPALKGLPKALVDKIRTREAEKIKIAMTQNPEEMKASQMASRLPELARVIYHIFVTDKKPALIKDLLCKRIVEGSKLIQNHSSVEEHIKLLEKVSLKWLTIHQLQAKTFVKINMKADINAVVAVLEKYKKSCV